ncbi:hypothetical protein OEZ86_004583 [Tetradesmus obliquus]|nr:hypothetical protein OEZ86_004583 [Tetradesmus obliquus]
MGVLALLLLAAAGHAADAQSGSNRKLKQTHGYITRAAKMPQEFTRELAAVNMCGVNCWGCRRDSGLAERLHNAGVYTAPSIYAGFGRNVSAELAVGINNTFAFWPEECALINFNGAIEQVFEMSAIGRMTGNACTFRGFRTWADVAALWSSPGEGTIFDRNLLKDPAGIIAMLSNAANRQAAWVETLPCDWQSQLYAAWGFPAITCDCSKLPTAIVGAAKPECRNRPLGQVHLNAALSNTAMTGLPWKVGSPMLFGCRA